MDPVSTAVSSVSTIVDATELITIKRNWFIRFINKCFRRKIRVLVFGDTGVGKTQFIKTLTGNNAYSFNPPVRTRQLQHYTLTLGSGRRVELIDTPGHQTNEFVRKTALNDIVRGKLDGIINLVDFGYRDSELVQKDPNAVFQVGTSTVKQEYLRENRQMEITRTKEFVKQISPDAKVRWILTVINKADVWDSERQDVINYYTKGPFNDVMEELSHAVQMAAYPFCSVITPFGNREMTLTYSERDKRRDFCDLVAVIEEFIHNRHGE